MEPTLNIRPILQRDNAALAQIIRRSLEEFGAAKPGTVYFESSTDHLSDLFKVPGSIYFVITLNGEVAGGAGIYPTENLPDGTCELVKLYLSASCRGKGYGKLLMGKCEKEALALGYDSIYLETMPELNIAVPLYEKMGYQYLKAPLGSSGHSGCDIWMSKPL